MIQEMELRKEKAALKQKWSNAFLNELEVIIEKCFLKQKNKKEHFITREKIELDLIKLLQSQKRFSNGESFKGNLEAQAAYDKIDNAVARILSINIKEKTVQCLNIFQQIVIRNFEDVIFFDVYSIEFAAIFEKQKIVHMYTYRDTFRFLTHKPETEKNSGKRITYSCFPPTMQKLVIPIDYSK